MGEIGDTDQNYGDVKSNAKGLSMSCHIHDHIESTSQSICLLLEVCVCVVKAIFVRCTYRVGIYRLSYYICHTINSIKLNICLWTDSNTIWHTHSNSHWGGLRGSGNYSISQWTGALRCHYEYN
jgi:hypothetical protein